MVNRSSFPSTLDDVSTKWLQSTLGGRTGSLASFSSESIGAAQGGVIGQLARLHLNWRAGATDDLPSTVVVKFPTNDVQRRLRPAYQALIAREAKFFRELATRISVPTPKCWYAEFDPDSGGGVLLLEDLGGGAILETGQASVADLERIAQAIAPLHAEWWGDDRLASMDWLMSAGPMVQGAVTLVRENIDSASRWYEIHAPDLLDLTRRLPDAIEAGLFADAPPGTLIHGDLKPQNVSVFGDEPVFFDWQFLGHSSPGAELVQLVSEGAESDPTMEVIERVLVSYHAALTASGVAAYDYAKLRDDFALNAMRALWAPVRMLSLPGPLSNDREAIARRWVRLAQAVMGPYRWGERIDSALQGA